MANYYNKSGEDGFQELWLHVGEHEVVAGGTYDWIYGGDGATYTSDIGIYCPGDYYIARGTRPDDRVIGRSLDTRERKQITAIVRLMDGENEIASGSVTAFYGADIYDPISEATVRFCSTSGDVYIQYDRSLYLHVGDIRDRGVVVYFPGESGTIWCTGRAHVILYGLDVPEYSEAPIEINVPMERRAGCQVGAGSDGWLYGRAEVTPDSTLAWGETVTVTAIPEGCYCFDHWEWDSDHPQSPGYDVYELDGKTDESISLTIKPNDCEDGGQLQYTQCYYVAVFRRMITVGDSIICDPQTGMPIYKGCNGRLIFGECECGGGEDG